MPEPLSARYKNSFAYKTVKDRMPVILTKVIDTIYRQRHDVLVHHGEKGIEQLKQVTGALSELRYRMTTDKPLLPIEGTRGDVKIWNNLLQDVQKKNGEDVTWFKGPWILTECYMYRRIVQAFDSSPALKNFDPFRYQKEEAFISSLATMQLTGNFLSDILTKHEQSQDKNVVSNLQIFTTFLQISLWGNKFDLSMSLGNVVQVTHNPIEHAHELNPFILCDDTSAVYDYLTKTCTNGRTRRIDIILDNAGMELFSDFCLAEYLLRTKLCDSIAFHVKSVPWFVSDTTYRDFSWTLEMLRGSHVPVLNTLGHLWHKRRDDGQIRVLEHDFWTTSCSFDEMRRLAPDLYDELAKAKLVILKGDLNYRKLVGDLNWPHQTDLETALRGFEPAPLVALRTTKSDVVVGVSEEKVLEATKTDKDWLISGNFAVVQFHSATARPIESKI